MLQHSIITNVARTKMSELYFEYIELCSKKIFLLIKMLIVILKKYDFLEQNILFQYADYCCGDCTIKKVIFSFMSYGYELV